MLVKNGSPPPAGSKVVLKFRSVNSIVIAPAPGTANRRTTVTKILHTNKEHSVKTNSWRSHVHYRCNEVRSLELRTLPLREAQKWHNLQLLWWIEFQLMAGYTVHPQFPALALYKNLRRRRTNAGGRSRNPILFEPGKPISENSQSLKEAFSFQILQSW